MKFFRWLIMLILIFLSSCQAAGTTYTILADGQTYTVTTNARTSAEIITAAGLTLGANDRLLHLGSPLSIDTDLVNAGINSFNIRRAVALTLVSPDGTKTIQTSAETVAQALAEFGYQLYPADHINPPPETPLEGPLTVNYLPSQNLLIDVDEKQVHVRSAAANVGAALAEAGVPLVGLDVSVPSEDATIPVNGEIRVIRRIESVSLIEQTLPYATRTEPSADLELDQQAMLQGGQPGLAVTRLRILNEDGIQVSQKTESESIVRPPQDRILGYGTKVVIRTAEVDGHTIQYYRALTLATTSYSPCRSATPDGRCSYGTSSGLPVQRGTVAMVYSWYLAFGFDRLYIPGYGYATVGDVGTGPAGSHYWVDLAFTDADYQPVSGSTMVYFLTPVPQNLVYILP